MTIQVAKVIDPHTVVINAGANYEIRIGQRFQIYSLGDEVRDPVTGESLGHLEMIKGSGSVAHVQDKMATIKSIMTEPGGKVLRQRNVVGFRRVGEGFSEERLLPPVPVPFSTPEPGDYARPI
jgi:hypothetical protein